MFDGTVIISREKKRGRRCRVMMPIHIGMFLVLKQEIGL